jgi:hypothetical protein
MPADIPSPYTAGQVTIPAGIPSNLGQLIQAQIDPNSALAAFQIYLQNDAANTTPILIGMDKTLSAAKYGFSLAVGADRPYGGQTGNNILIGRFYVFSTASAILHIEIFP